MKALLTLCLMSVCVFAQPSAEDILKKIDALQNMGKDVKAKVVLTQQKANQGAKVLEMVYYRRDVDNSFLIAMTAPEAEKGNGYLRIGDNFWMYRKNTRTFQHVNRDESIGGSDASGEDFETRKITELYKPARGEAGDELIAEEKLGKNSVYRIEVIAKVSDVSYPKKIYWVRKDNFLPLKEQEIGRAHV
jgi:outer membrane lipoprotein-sorting protein